MLSRQRERLLLHVERGGLLDGVLSLFDVADRTFLFQFREGQLYGLDVVFLQFPLYDGVVVPVDEGILGCLVLDDSHLRVHIVLHAVLVAVQVVGRDVHQDGYVGAEVIHIVELEAGQFDDVVFVRVLCHLECQTPAYIAGQSGIVAG